MIETSYDHYKTTKIKRFSNAKENIILNSMSKLNYGIFIWDYTKNTLFINEFMEKNFMIDLANEKTIGQVFEARISDNSEQKFYQVIQQIKNSNEVKSLQYPVVDEYRNLWFSVNLYYQNDQDSTLGVIESINTDKTKDFSYNESSKQITTLFENLPFKIYYTDPDGDVIYKNEVFDDTTRIIHESIEKLIISSNEYISLNLLDRITVIEKNENTTTFEVQYKRNKMKRNITVKRKEVLFNNQKCILYIHEDANSIFKDESNLKKIIKVNDLIFEIRDIVDNESDLNHMFDYLLSKIQTVIPSANRSCILRINELNNLYMKSSFGFTQDFISTFNLPFKESYAYMHLQNDYSKSVIIDDIQMKYSNLFPDLEVEKFGMLIQSNVTTPIVVNGEFYGIVSIDSNENRVFDEVDLYLLDYMKYQIERAIEKHRRFAVIRRDSNIDPLTGVPNRRELMKAYENLRKSKRVEDQSFYVVMFDLDKLKIINDTYGHVAGDKVIKQLSFMIKENMRDTDFQARIGGDEFVGIYKNITKDDLIVKMDNLTKYLQTHPLTFRNEHFITKFSYGIAKYPEEGVSMNAILDQADKRMYEQKRSK